MTYFGVFRYMQDTQYRPAYNISLMRIYLDPAGMHCPAWDDAFVSSLLNFYLFITSEWQ